MNELENLFLQKNSNEVLVSARKIHKELGISKRFSAWKTQNFKLFKEDEDFTSVLTGAVVNNGAKRKIQDYALTLDMAKHIALMSKTEKGKKIREYFIEVEKKYRNNQTPSYLIEDEIQRAQKWIEEQQEKRELQNKIKQDRPKVDFHDNVLHTKSTISATQTAKNYGMSTVTFNELLHDLKIQYKRSGQWLLYAKHQDKGYVESRTKVLNGKYGEFSKVYSRWTQKGREFLYEELKKQGILPVSERKLLLN